jgi:galactoside O-acetyltransferase
MHPKIKKWFFQKPKIWLYQWLSDAKNVSGNPIMVQPVLLSGPGNLVFGEKVQLGVIQSPYFYSHYIYMEARTSESLIEIGNFVAINNGSSFVAMNKISIGNHVFIGTNCQMMDSDGHDLHPNKRRQPGISKPIRIEDNVLIGSDVKVLKGVCIGKNAVIGNGTIVFKDVPENAVVAGNPMKIIKMLT